MSWLRWKKLELQVEPSNFAEVNAAIAKAEAAHRKALEQAATASKEAGKLRQVNINNGFAPAILGTINRHQGGNP